MKGKPTSGKRRRQAGLQDVAGRLIKRVWGNLEVVDAKKDLRVFIRPEDVVSARPKDPACCVFARACIRQFDASHVLFFRSVAYVDLPQSKGVRRVERFYLGKGMRELIEAFDRGETDIPAAGFLLQAPPPGRTLESLCAKEKRKREKCKLLGKSRVIGGNRGGGSKFQDKPLLLELTVRNGSGQVHFPFAKEDTATKQSEGEA